MDSLSSFCIIGVQLHMSSRRDDAVYQAPLRILWSLCRLCVVCRIETLPTCHYWANVLDRYLSLILFLNYADWLYPRAIATPLYVGARLTSLRLGVFIIFSMMDASS